MFKIFFLQTATCEGSSYVNISILTKLSCNMINCWRDCMIDVIDNIKEYAFVIIAWLLEKVAPKNYKEQL